MLQRCCWFLDCFYAVVGYGLLGNGWLAVLVVVVAADLSQNREQRVIGGSFCKAQQLESCIGNESQTASTRKPLEKASNWIHLRLLVASKQIYDGDKY